MFQNKLSHEGSSESYPITDILTLGHCDCRRLLVRLPGPPVRLLNYFWADTKPQIPTDASTGVRVCGWDGWKELRGME